MPRQLWLGVKSASGARSLPGPGNRKGGGGDPQSPPPRNVPAHSRADREWLAGPAYTVPSGLEAT
jgi:hypothetical protein